MADVVDAFSSIFVIDSFYIIGGRIIGGFLNTIVRLHTITWKWSQAGIMSSVRRGLSVIWVPESSKLVVAGGKEKNPTEICELSSGNFTCVANQTSILNDYARWPLLFIVSDDFIDCDNSTTV